jgi:hypothetical protein
MQLNLFLNVYRPRFLNVRILFFTYRVAIEVPQFQIRQVQ